MAACQSNLFGSGGARFAVRTTQASRFGQGILLFKSASLTIIYVIDISARERSHRLTGFPPVTSFESRSSIESRDICFFLSLIRNQNEDHDWNGGELWKLPSVFRLWSDHMVVCHGKVPRCSVSNKTTTSFSSFIMLVQCPVYRPPSLSVVPWWLYPTRLCVRRTLPGSLQKNAKVRCRANRGECIVLLMLGCCWLWLYRLTPLLCAHNRNRRWSWKISSKRCTLVPES